MIMIKLHTPENGAVVSLQTEEQKVFCEKHDELSVGKRIDWQNLTRTNSVDHTFPGPVVFECEGGEAELTVSDSPEFANVLCHITSNSPCEVCNLEIGKTYYWRISRDGKVSETRTFFTDDIAPRWLYIDGATNVRDVGGWHIQGGGQMRQGLLYRGSEFDTHCEITDAGLVTARKTLGIVTDLDLRGEVVGKRTSSPLGGDIRYRLIPISPYAELATCKGELKAIFELLAERDNYPVYFHCWGGADRTGSLAIIIQALCGIAEKDIFLDYELTSLSLWGTRSSASEYIKTMMAELEPYGDSLQTRAVGFLLGCGISKETLDTVVDILTDK